MSSPRRYRAALWAYPARYRTSRGPELLATLADGDDTRGHPSSREALALTYRGLAMRAGGLGSPAGLLTASAVAILLAVLGWFQWAEHVLALHGERAVILGDGPGWWLILALGLSAYLVVAIGPFRAANDPGRRRIAAGLALPFALAVFTSPGRIFQAGVPAWATVTEFATWSPQAVFHNWHMTLPGSLGAVLVTWVALAILGPMGPRARQRALAGALLLLGTVSIAQAWSRPDLPVVWQPQPWPRDLVPVYSQSAFADLGTASFVAGLGLVLVVAALWRTRGQAPQPAADRG